MGSSGETEAGLVVDGMDSDMVGVGGERRREARKEKEV